jgi:hypothetical protein
MADAKKIATREAYGEALAEFGAVYDNLVVLDADLSKSTKTVTFKKKFPERHINCGIAESNMMAVAAGLATTGKIVFASSFAMFAAGRAFEQIRNSVGYPHLNVKIGATHAGLSVGEDGATHQCNEDIALMRTIPGMVILSPSDAVESRASDAHRNPAGLRSHNRDRHSIGSPDRTIRAGEADRLSAHHADAARAENRRRAAIPRVARFRARVQGAAHDSDDVLSVAAHGVSDIFLRYNILFYRRYNQKSCYCYSNYDTNNKVYEYHDVRFILLIGRNRHNRIRTLLCLRIIIIILL